jgi:cytochrome c oxidase subunit IV
VADTSHLQPGRPQTTAAVTADGVVADAHAHPGPKVYIQVAAWLALATAIEVGLYYLDMPHGLFIGLLMSLMIVKFATVAMYFMHLKFDAPIFRRLMVTGITLAIIVYLVVLATFGLFR